VVFTLEGKQRVLAEIPDYPLEIEDLREFSTEKQEQQLEIKRSQYSHEVLDITQFPIFKFRVSHYYL
jgi:hypothetical protein